MRAWGWRCEMLQIIGVKTNKGFYIQGRDGDSSYTKDLISLLFNGKNPEKTFESTWFFVESEVLIVEKKVSQPNINHRYELKEDLPFTEGFELPKVMPKDEVMELDEDGKYCEWKDEFKHLQTFYELKSDPQEPKIETVEFSFTIILEIPEIKAEPDFKYTVQQTGWSSNQKTYNIKMDSIIHQTIDKIVFPWVVLPSLPSAMSSADTYKIIRQYVKHNIDQRYAQITSDYDFCFEVAKVVPLATPIETQRELKTSRGHSFRKRKYSHSLVKNRVVKKVFEMTYSPENYKGYTPIPSFVGKDHQDLKKNIDKYLNALMSRINEPLIECKHCDGMGVILEVNHA
jgi:hypothetical protein